MKTYRLIVSLSLLFLLVISSAVLAKGTVNMEFKQAPLVDVFQILGELGGFNVLVDPSVKGDVTFALRDLTVEDALDLVTRTTGYRYKLIGNTLVVGSEQRLKTEFGTEDFSFVPIRYVDVAAAQRLVALVVPNVKTYVDNEQSLLILFGLTSDLDLARQILKEYDQKDFVTNEPSIENEKVTKPSFIQARVPVFYANGEEILAAVKQLWPLREFSWDGDKRNIVGQATEEEWNEIESFVQKQDLPDFILKGILGTKDETLILIEYRGVASLLRQGDFLNDWQLSDVQDGAVEFRQDKRSFIIRMGR